MNLTDRLNSVRDTASERKLKSYALNDPSERVREIAASKLTDPIVLSHIVHNDESLKVVKKAVQNIDDEFELKNAIIYLINETDKELSDILKKCLDKITDLSYLMEIFKKSNSIIALNRIKEINPKILFIISDSKQDKLKIYTKQAQLVKLLENNSLHHDELKTCVSAIHNPDLLKHLVKSGSWRVRPVAAEHITDPDFLKEMALSDDNSVCRTAIKRITDQKVLEEIALNLSLNKCTGCYWACIAAINKVSSEDVLKEIALNATSSDERKEATKNIGSNDILMEIASESEDEYVIKQAIDSIDDVPLLMDISLHSNNNITEKLDQETKILYDALKKEGV